ncbi:MAG: CxxxxCH/CxxCH domain-containing protein [Desulfuromonadales bacterium]|nr:CxxxxCH/CxxCH domain-containing protein [Desulfuromonadales bacterium]
MPGSGAVLTHPLLSPAELESVQTDPVKSGNYTDMTGTLVNYDATNRYVNGALLTDGGVGCVSCHGAHYTDSDASTADGPGTFNTGDDLLLRGDGPLRSGATRNDTAQLRSNLCQDCHTMELHGQTSQMLGCLDCHGGHAYNGGVPNAYILRAQSLENLPTRMWVWNGSDYDLTYGSAPINFGAYGTGGSTRTKWADDVEGTADGMCEQCHGDVNGGKVKLMASEHEAGDTNECTVCHMHNDPADIYSFNRDASAATCGQCHGFPPYLNVPGDRQLVPANDGGYAENNSADQGTPYDYLNDSGHFKNEEQTGHKVHAGADLPTSPAGSDQWYFVGTAGVDNCKVCHGPNAGKVEGGHRIDPVTDPATFRDMFFDGIAETGGMVPSYDFATAFTCDNVYCHTNGAPYNGASRPNRDYSVINVTPPWVGTGANYAAGGFGSIYSQPNRCALCHGNSSATMASKSNTAVHAAHIGGTTSLNMGIVFSCSVCHVSTANDADTLAPGAMNGRIGGKHVNGLIDVDYDMAALDGTLATSTYNVADGSCATFCHNVTGDAGAVAVDWDVATAMQCDSCHGGLMSDTSADGGYGPIATDSHLRHITTADGGPGLSCDDCHGLNSGAGTHAAHLDGIIDVIDPVDSVSFADICQECHGYDSETGEVLPVWGNPATTDCATCHDGQFTSSGWSTAPDAPGFMTRTSGHGRLPASGSYPVSGNVPADSNCLDCHQAADPAHFSGGLGDTMMLRTDIGFPANYSADPDAFCANCHGSSPQHPTRSASVATRDMTTHAGKQCIACHNVHGTTNIQMVYSSQAEQSTRDTSANGKYTGTVTFTAQTGENSYDEDDGVAGGGGELNADDICATCHSLGEGVTHNNSNNSNVDHYQGEDCFTCHGNHQAEGNAFKVGVGTACNDCHGFPPATAAHLLHAKSASNDKDIEDISDCAFCHTGANLFTYDLSADQAAGGDRANHAKGQTARRTVLGTAVGYETVDFTCTTACHASTASNGGRWSDTTGLACDACHYTAVSPSSVGNAGDLSSSHNKHFDSGRGACSLCHDVAYSPSLTAVSGPLAHISDTSGANEGLMYQGMAMAVADEAEVLRISMTFDDGLNTCSGSGVGLGCHATGTPDWDVAFPVGNGACLECHTDTTTASVNPTSGLHNNSPAPVTSGVAHDGDFLYNGGANTGDCITCHTATPSSAHYDGTLNTSTPIVILAADVGFAAGSPPSCMTVGSMAGCHLEGSTWGRLWDTRAYNNDASRCAVCHGTYSTDWVAGTIHAEAGNETRGAVHNNAGSSSYPCADCHVLGSAAYTYNDTTIQWAGTSHHGDDKLQINSTGTGFTDAGARVGCATASCHGATGKYDFQKSAIYTVAGGSVDLMAGDVPDVPCSGCHGGGTVGAARNNYWPDSSNLRAENTVGAHPVHMAELALSVYGESVAQLLADTGNGSADAKQKHLCAYCHDNPGADADHGGALPAEVNSMYAMWDTSRATADNGVWNVGAGTCATVDCHFNKTTPTTPVDFSWYGGQAGTCVMCHLDITSDLPHTAHMDAPTLFGMTIACSACHDAATDWSSNTGPASGHFDGSYDIAGSVTFTYDGSKSCGTNFCHSDGKGGAPKTASYPWNGGALGDCSICHDASPTTDAHTVHLAGKVSAYVPNSCDDCHTAGSNAAHIDGSVSYAGAISAAPGDGSCANTCHLSPEAGDWTGGPSAIVCTDCHSGSGASAYIGGDKSGVAGPNYMPQYNMHPVTPSVSGVVHDQTTPGAGGDCAFCHTGITGLATHINGVWAADSANNSLDQPRGLYAGFTDGTPPTCTTACHSAGAGWTYKWSASAALTDGSQCANCHGTFSDGWNTGVMHQGMGTRGNNAHTDSGNLGFPCNDCHGFGALNSAYPFTYTSNDWAATDAGATTLHGDGFITMNETSTGWARASGYSGCDACHAGANQNGNSHDFPASGWTAQTVAGDAPNVSGSCTACHGDGGTGAYWPSGVTAPNRPGTHLEHVSAIAKHLPGGDSTANRNSTCSYCHPDPGGSGHNDGGDAELTLFKNILTGAQTDPDGVLNAGSKTCSTVDCHFNNAVTPHWYADTFPPAQVALTAVSTNPAVEPRAIRLSWTSPGDDDNVADTTVYRYDMRYGTSSAIASDFARTDNYVGGLPLAYAQGTLQDVLADNLTPGQTYYFSLRSQDVAGNWSTPSLVASAVASGDTLKPYFGGVNRAFKGDKSQTINVEWSHAEDHTMPVTYDLWMVADGAGSGPNGTLDMNVDPPLITGIKGYKYQLTAADGVANDTEYLIGVRACDGVTPTANCDDNTEIILVTPTDVPLVPQTYPVFRANGAVSGGYVGLEKGASFTSAATSALPVTFRPAANEAYPTTYFVDGFSLLINNGNANSTIRATLGYSTGNNFTAFVPAVTADVTMGKRASGVKTFKFGDIAGKTINAGQRLAVQVTVVSGIVSDVGWGSAANGGTLTAAERLVNVAPTNPNLQGAVIGALVNLTWTESTDTADAVDDTVHYDLYGSDDNGASWHYKIAHGLPATTTAYSWNTQMHGIALNGAANVAVKIEAGDGFTHTESLVTGLSVDNSTDNVAPDAITDLVVKRRAKGGAVMLRWTAPGDDYENNGRATYYDVRYSTSPITEGNFNSATRFYGAPLPGFGGHIEEMELTGLDPLVPYYFAIKTYDEGGNGSAISTPKYTTPTPTNQEIGGPRCGMCHTTAPSVVESVGNHRIHGITVEDCTECHGSQVASFGLDHQDGLLLMGWGDNAYEAIIDGSRIYYTDTGTSGGNVLYDDPDGGGGFYNGNYNGIGDGIDDGTCMNFVAGCHGPAGTPGYGLPNWISTAKLDCADCHGDPNRTVDTVYGLHFDSTVDNGGVVTEQVKGSPPIDNHGLATGKYVGLHEKHLNYSFRFAKGDSCNLCHPGRYSDKNDLDGKHGDGYIDVKLYNVAAGDDAYWAPGSGATPGTCGSMSADNCHPTSSTPAWDSAVSFDCVQCHGFDGVTPSHVTDPNGGVSSPDNGWGTDPMQGNCTYCHPGGHPRDDVGGTMLILANSSQVGINYRSGGIHLKKSIGGRAARQTEAELCWQCHDANGISEWGTDAGNNNTATRPPNNNNYNFGSLSQSNWVGATWTSGNASFGYKTGPIQSTHATGPFGTADVVSNRFRNHSETVDPVENIRCSNCHDVHNMNKAPGDEVSGPPYLRGTWLSNPYKEDGAPRSGMTFTSQNKYGAVPRGGTAYVQDGGYFIDQNSGNPTAGYSVATSAGLCTLCHGSDVDNMDKTLGENLWLGTNGHSNSAIGGTGTFKVNIFDTGNGTAGSFGPYSGRPQGRAPTARSYETAHVPDMGYFNAADPRYEGHGLRGTGGGTTYTASYTPATNPANRAYAFDDFDWGVSVDATGIDTGYHVFSCSKCHNPHASRLPKLMITNCLDVRHNTWDDGFQAQNHFTVAKGSNNMTDYGKRAASWDSAQNCHRFNERFSVTATNISFQTGPDRITSGTAIFTSANGYRVGDRVQITGGVNAGKVGTISSLTNTVLTLSDVTGPNGAATTLTAAGTGTSITLEGARGGWNKITPW